MTNIRARRGAFVLGIMLAGAAHPSYAQNGRRSPIIDMHLHAEHVADYGPTPTVCSDNRGIVWNAWDPRTALDPTALGTCSSPLWRAPATDNALLRESVAMLDRYNIRAVTTGTPADVAAWRAASPARIIRAVSFFEPGRDSLGRPRFRPLAELCRLVADGQAAVFAEISAQYRGLSPADPALEPYFALAEELDVPVGVHMGEATPGVEGV